MGIFTQLINGILGRANPGKRPRNRDLMVIVRRNSSDPCDVRFELDGDTEFSNNGRPGFNVFIDIDDPDNTGCTFHAADPLWVQPFSGTPVCPTSPANWDQFVPVGVFNKGKTLLVRNRNDNIQKFAFSLRFNISGCSRVVDFDPIGSNQNGFQ